MWLKHLANKAFKSDSQRSAVSLRSSVAKRRSHLNAALCSKSVSKDIMKDWFKINSSSKKISDKFKLLLDEQYTAERKLLGSWIEDFHVKDGLDKTVNQFQETFHSTFWEIYLNKVFKKSGYEVDEKIVSPDFCISKNEKKIFVEAVVSNIARDEPKESARTVDDIYGNNDLYSIIDESITRLYNSVCNKFERFDNAYSHNDEVLNSPFIFAIGDYAQINYGQSYYYPLLALLYGAYYDVDDKKADLKILCQDSFGKEYKFLENHKKKNGANLKIGLFNDSKYSYISALIYSCTTTLGKLSSLCENHVPYDKCIVLDREINNLEHQVLRYSKQSPDETLHDGIFVFHNPYAEKKLPDDFLNDEGVVHISYDQEIDPAITINYAHGKGILKRRQVCMRGTEKYLIENFEDFSFVPVART